MISELKFNLETPLVVGKIQKHIYIKTKKDDLYTLDDMVYGT